MLVALLSCFTLLYVILLFKSFGVYYDRNTYQSLVHLYNGLHLVAVAVEFIPITWAVYARFRLLNWSLR